MSSPEEIEPITLHEGHSLHAVLAGAGKLVNLSIERVRRRKSGELEGDILAADATGLDAVQQLGVMLPATMTFAEGDPVVVEAEQEGQESRWPISPKVAAFLGAATLVGGVAVTYRMRHRS